MTNLINIGVSGLTASQAAMNVIGNNISNADTKGYSRQTVSTTASALQNIGVGYLGTGTTISDVRRIYNSYMERQLQTTTSLSADATAYQTQVSATDTLLSDSSTGIASALTSFFTSLQTASSSPNDSSSRQLLLTQAQGLSSRFQSISSQLSQQNDGINSQLSALSDQVNSLSTQVASLNKQISALSASGTQPNSLLDARNEAVRSLNELVGVTVQERDGNYDVYLGTGQPLVSGVNSNTLSASPSNSDSSQFSLTLKMANFSTDVTSVATGGSIGGLLRYRSDVLNPTINSLGRIALTVSDAVNTQLGQGLDANGQFGSSLFSDVNNSIAITQRSVGSISNSSGSGNLNVNISDTSKLTTYDYQVKFSDADNYSVTRSDGTSMGSYKLSDSPAPTIDGFQLSLNGNAVSAGDSFKVQPTRSGANSVSTTLTDASKLAFAAPLVGTAGSSNTGTGSITQPTLTTALNIHDSAALSEMQSAVKNSTPVKLVFSAASGGSQSYTMYNAQGTSIGTGSIVPGQANTLSLSIPMVDASGNPILDSSGAQKTFSAEMTINGSPATSDSISVAFNSSGKTDNRNAQQLLALQTKATIGVSNGNSGMSLTNANASLVENVGAKAAQAKTDVSLTGSLVDTAKSNRDSVSGVSLDEEASSLVKYQQYYTASSQIIKTAQSIFDTLINAL